MPNENIQSVIFNKHIWTIDNARKWLKIHKFDNSDKIDITNNYIRFRQKKPNKKNEYFTKILPNYHGIELIIIK